MGMWIASWRICNKTTLTCKAMFRPSLPKTHQNLFICHRLPDHYPASVTLNKKKRGPAMTWHDQVPAVERIEIEIWSWIQHGLEVSCGSHKSHYITKTWSSTCWKSGRTPQDFEPGLPNTLDAKLCSRKNLVKLDIWKSPRKRNTREMYL